MIQYDPSFPLLVIKAPFLCTEYDQILDTLQVQAQRRIMRDLQLIGGYDVSIKAGVDDITSSRHNKAKLLVESKHTSGSVDFHRQVNVWTLSGYELHIKGDMLPTNARKIVQEDLLLFKTYYEQEFEGYSILKRITPDLSKDKLSRLELMARGS